MSMQNRGSHPGTPRTIGKPAPAQPKKPKMKIVEEPCRKCKGRPPRRKQPPCAACAGTGRFKKEVLDEGTS